MARCVHDTAEFSRNVSVTAIELFFIWGMSAVFGALGGWLILMVLVRRAMRR